MKSNITLIVEDYCFNLTIYRFIIMMKKLVLFVSFLVLGFTETPPTFNYSY